MKRTICLILTVLLSLALVFLAAENYLAYKGWRLSNVCLPVPESELSPLYDKCGWISWPGVMPSTEDPAVTETVWENGQRASRPSQEKTGEHNVLLLGCSYTFGSGVKDSDTFAWLLNSHYIDGSRNNAASNNYKISFDNYAVLGYGTYQSLMTENYLLNKASTKYDLVIYGCMEKHFWRNVVCHSPGTDGFSPSIITPYVKVSDNLNTLNYYPADSRQLLLENQLLSVRFLKTAYLRSFAKDRPEIIATQEQENAAMRILIQNMKTNAEKHGAEFLLLAYDPKTSSRFKTIKVQDICQYLDLSFPEMDTAASRVNGSLDNHPNAATHKKWAEQLESWLDKHLAAH